VKSIIAIFAIAAILATGVVLTTTTQQALADKVGPNGPCPCPPGEDVNKQGALGEFYSKDGRATYYGGISGTEFGGSISDNAKSQPGLIGSNTAFYGSGECHGKVPEACLP